MTASDESTAIAPEESLERISELTRGMAGHPALDNAFYPLWMGGELPVEKVELIARNYYARVSRTPERIALAFLNIGDLISRVETVENLFDEMGHGDPAKAHSVLLRGFWETLLGKLRGRPVRFDELGSALLPSTTRAVEGGEKLFSSPYPQEVSGALLAQEWHAYPQLVYMYEGARNYRRHYGLEEFHETCEYFYLHIGAAEKEHKVQSMTSAAQVCRTTADLKLLERGFTGYLDLLAENWAEIHEAVTA